MAFAAFGAALPGWCADSRSPRLHDTRPAAEAAARFAERSAIIVSVASLRDICRSLASPYCDASAPSGIDICTAQQAIRQSDATAVAIDGDVRV